MRAAGGSSARLACAGSLLLRASAREGASHRERLAAAGAARSAAHAEAGAHLVWQRWQAGSARGIAGSPVPKYVSMATAGAAWHGQAYEGRRGGAVAVAWPHAVVCTERSLAR